MPNLLSDVILDKFEALPALQLAKILKIASDVKAYKLTDPLPSEKMGPLSVFIGKSIPTAEIYQMMFSKGANHVVQLDRKDVLFEMILSAVLCKQPDELIKPDSTFLLQKFTDKSAQTMKTLILPFSSTNEKVEILERVESFLRSNPALMKLTSRITQIADELIMNAMFDAPVDKNGRRLFYSTPRANLISYPDPTKKAKLKIHYDESRILIGCEDPWGSIDEAFLRKHLSRALKETTKISQAHGQGGGLGLKMIIEGSTSFYTLVRRHVHTSVYCGFDLSVSYKKIEITPKHAHIVFIG